jgi:hypothetical protein
MALTEETTLQRVIRYLNQPSTYRGLTIIATLVASKLEIMSAEDLLTVGGLVLGMIEVMRSGSQ